MKQRPSKFERSLRLLGIAGPRCIKCRTERRFFEDYCIDCWPGYDLCKSCGDYRCEHLLPDEQDLSDPEFISCHCGNLDCRTGFVEGSEYRICTQTEFRDLKQHWAAEANAESAPGG